MLILSNYNFMTPRLLAVAGMVEKGARVADIGTDHAYIPIYLIQNNIAVSAVASDLNKGPAMRAERNIRRYGLDGKIRVCVADGLNGIENGEADTVILAGMGGRLMCDLMSDKGVALGDINMAILQPMGDIDVVRRWLCQNGWNIVDEVIAQEQEKLYIVIKSIKCNENICECKEELWYYLGEKLIEKKDKLLPLYLDKEIVKLNKAINGMEISDKFDERLEFYKYLLKGYTDILEGLNNGKNM